MVQRHLERNHQPSGLYQWLAKVKLQIFFNFYDHTYMHVVHQILFIEGSLEVKLPTIWRDEKQSRAEAERRGRLAERRSEEKE